MHSSFYLQLYDLLVVQQEVIVIFLLLTSKTDASSLKLKVGTAVVTQADGRLALGRLGSLCEQVLNDYIIIKSLSQFIYIHKTCVILTFLSCISSADP